MTGATGVSFGSTSAVSFNVVSATQVTAVVPPGATTGKVTLQMPKGPVVSATDFTVVVPPPPPVAAGPEQSTTAAASPTVRPIPNSDIMYKKSVWRKIELKEKQNRPMFSSGREITKIIIEAAKRGELTPYFTDSLTRVMPLAKFKERMVDQKNSAPQLTEEEKKIMEQNADADGFGSAAPVSTGPSEIYPNQLRQLQLKEDMVFDKKRSRMYHQIQCISLVLPSGLTVDGTDAPIATFKYADLVKVFRNNPEQAIWFNRDNDAQHKNLADAFELWLFSSYIYKVSNPDDEQIEDQVGTGNATLLAAQQLAGDMIEFEYNLWSF